MMTEHENEMKMTETPEVSETKPENEQASQVENLDAEAQVASDAQVDTDAQDTELGDADELEDVTEAPANPNFKWYVVHTYSGYENRAKASLEERIRQQSQESFFGEILIPTENVMELGKGGQKKTTKRKFFPGYMLVQMELTDDSWHMVKGTPKITGFVGNATKPPSIPEVEVRRLTQQIDEGTLKPKPRVQFEEGEDVRVVDGPFANFNGVVDAVNEDKGKVRVLVSIFGRATPVELDFIQVEKVG